MPSPPSGVNTASSRAGRSWPLPCAVQVRPALLFHSRRRSERETSCGVPSERATNARSARNLSRVRMMPPQSWGDATAPTTRTMIVRPLPGAYPPFPRTVANSSPLAVGVAFTGAQQLHQVHCCPRASNPVADVHANCEPPPQRPHLTRSCPTAIVGECRQRVESAHSMPAEKPTPPTVTFPPTPHKQSDTPPPRGRPTPAGCRPA